MDGSLLGAYAHCMPKVDYRRWSDEQRLLHIQELLSVCAKFGLSADGQHFLQDLCTESEIVMFARRIHIAHRLILGKRFQDIQKELHVGLNTITSIDRWLEHKLASYRRTLPRLLLRTDSAERDNLITKNYPSHSTFIHVLSALP